MRLRVFSSRRNGSRRRKTAGPSPATLEALERRLLLDVGSIYVSSNVPLDIPDYNPQDRYASRVHSDIIIETGHDNAHVTAVDVSFDMWHEYARDLVIDLESSERSYRLWSRNYPNLAQYPDYPINYEFGYEKTGIGRWNGLTPNTTWSLYLWDVAQGNTGRLESWDITIHYAWTPLPDLQGYVCLAPSAINWGETFTLQGSVENEGDREVTTDFYQEFYLSNDTTFGDADDVYLGQYYHTADIAAASTGPQFDVDLTLPTSPPTGYSNYGTFYIGMKTDATDVIDDELDETDNFGQIGKFQDWCAFSAQLLADVEVTTLTMGPAVIEKGSSPTSLTYSIKNSGPTDIDGGDYAISLYLSTDDTITDADIWLGDLALQLSIPAGNTVDYTATAEQLATLNIPVGIASSPYWVGAHLSPTGTGSDRYDDPNDANNWLAGNQVNITNVIPPDLQTSIAQVWAADELHRGDSFTVVLRETNAGHVHVAAGEVFHRSFYLSTDGILDAGDVELVPVDTSHLVENNGIEAGASLPGSTYPPRQVAFLVPADLPFDDYYVIAETDSQDEIDEGIFGGEDNNTDVTATAVIQVYDTTHTATLTEDSAALQFTDATGDQVTVTYLGNGQAVVTFDGRTGNDCDIESIVVTGATSNSSLNITANSDTTVGSVEVIGTGFRTLLIDGDLGSLDITTRPGSKFKDLIVNGTLGDVSGGNTKKISRIEADSIIGEIEARYISKLTANDDFDGANVSLTGSKGRLKELRAGDDITDSNFAASRVINKAYVGGDIEDSTFTAYGPKAKLGNFYVDGDVVDSAFNATGEKAKLGKFYIAGDIDESDFYGSSIKGIFGGYDAKGKPLADNHFFRGSITATGKISRAYFTGAFYGTMEAYKIDRAGSLRDYFRDPVTGQKDPHTNHLFSTKPLKPSKIFDADGNMK